MVHTLTPASVAFRKDTHPSKQNLGVGAYRDDQGKPFVLSCVREAEKKLANANHEYAPIGGEPAFSALAASLLLGEDSKPLKEKRVASIQTLSGTGALRVAAEFFARFLPQKEIYFPVRPPFGHLSSPFRSHPCLESHVGQSHPHF